MQPCLRRTIHVAAMLCVPTVLLAQQAAPGKNAANAPEVIPQISGIGVALIPNKNDRGYEVFRVVPNSPAALSCEIERGDIIFAVGDADSSPDDIEIIGMAFEKVIGMIRGPVGSEVRLRIIPKSSSFVKQKVVSLKRRMLSGDGLVGNELNMTLTSLEDRALVKMDTFVGRAVVLIFWSGKCDDCVPQIRETIIALSDRQVFPARLELIAVNCDQSIEEAVKSAAEAKIEGVSHVWIDPKSRESVASEGLPLIIVMSPSGQVDAVCPPESINLEKFVKQYAAEKPSVREKRE